MSCWHRESMYFVRVMGTLGDNEVECLEKGVDIGEDKLTRPAKVRCLDKKELDMVPEDPGYPGEDESCLELSICEGKFHQVKRMLAAVGHPVLYLKRLSLGGIVLDPGLAPGEYRRLTQEEIAALKCRSKDIAGKCE